MVTLTAHGAAGEVTGSKHLLEAGRAKILIDCGMFQGKREEADRKNREMPFDPGSITACLNTHGHLDHCGAYPLLVKQGFAGGILATGATRDLARLIMLDSARLQEADARFLEKRQQRHPQPGRKVFPPLYDEDDALTAVAAYRTVPYRRPSALAPGVTATLFDAGHILGSASARLDLETPAGPMAVAFSGDLGRRNTPILRDPEPPGPVDYLVCESTYGDRLHDDNTHAAEDLAGVIRDTVAVGGRLLIPAFAIGRVQELVWHLHQLWEAGRIPRVPVYVDSPMAVSATGVFKAHRECYDAETVARFLDQGESPFAFDGLHYVGSAEESKRLNTLPGPCVIVSASGMCEGGRILHHLLNGLGDPRNTVCFVGFMGAHTLGRALADGADQVRVFGEPVQVRARVRALHAFSAHADQRELLEWVGGFDRARLNAVFLVHGEPEAQSELKRRLQAQGLARVEVLAPGEAVRLAG
jgi:metallo-beta-lactamase family protein